MCSWKKKTLLLIFKLHCDFSFEVTLQGNIQRKDRVLDNVVSCWLGLSYGLFGVFCGGGTFLKQHAWNFGTNHFGKEFVWVIFDSMKCSMLSENACIYRKVNLEWSVHLVSCTESIKNVSVYEIYWNYIVRLMCHS